MTEAQVLALINQFIIANGNNEITANVLRPILVAMLEQPNDKVGELADLDTTDQSTIVEAINELVNTVGGGFAVHTGIPDPNVTPPSSFSIGDWYIRNGTSLYQYNGSTWILVSTGSGTVQSVTGPTVDNTDPLNPVVNLPTTDPTAQPSRVISGGMEWVSGLTYESVNLVYQINGITFEITDGTQVTLDTADGSDPRIDLIYGDDAGLLDKSTGTPAAVPTANTLPSYQLQLKIALVNALATTPSGVAIRTVYLENLQEAGGEFDTSESTGAARIDLANTTTPIQGTVDIRTIAALSNGDTISFDHTTATTFANFSSLKFSIKNLVAWGNDYFFLEFRDGVSVVARVTVNSSMMNVSDITNVQTITIFKNDLTIINNTQFDGIDVYNRIVGGSAMKYQLDNIYINEDGGTTQPSSFVSPLTTKGDLLTFDTGNVRIPVGADEEFVIADSSQPTGLRWGSIDGGAP